jgi:hypothetical protein
VHRSAMPIPPAGLAPAGFFVPQKFTDPSAPPAILADAIDPETGEYLSISRGCDPIDQQVLIAMTAERGSGSALENDGQKFGGIRKITETTEALIDGEARRALARLVDARDIRVRRVYANAQPDNDWGEVSVDYENLRAPDVRRRLARVNPVQVNP